MTGDCDDCAGIGDAGAAVYGVGMAIGGYEPGGATPFG